MRVMDPEKDKKTTFVNCVVKDLSAAAKTPKLSAKLSVGTKVDAEKSSAPWQADSSEHKWTQLSFSRPTKINEFMIAEDPSSSVTRYFIECWDTKMSKWVSVFNGMHIGKGFIAPIVERATTKVRLRVLKTKSGKAKIVTFTTHYDKSGDKFNVARGKQASNRVGK